MAMDHYDRAQKLASKDPELRTALDLVILTIRRWTHRGWEGSLEGASFGCIRWFFYWDSGGRKGGIPRFRNGLRRAMKAANTKVVPRSNRAVQGVNDGKPTFVKARVKFRPLVDDARELVRVWNARERDAGTLVRYRCTRNGRDGPDVRIIIQYRIEPIVKPLSLDVFEGERGRGDVDFSDDYAWDDIV